ncbi:hypothetical protein HMPREF9016_00889 [Neisseria sp. oral taxon 014 str. F0314]|nr:hypothetical protein HMPREF9016_00889 [Neisseria sp. oral taxon 014 str. F0314]
MPFYKKTHFLNAFSAIKFTPAAERNATGRLKTGCACKPAHGISCQFPLKNKADYPRSPRREIDPKNKKADNRRLFRTPFRRPV